MEVEFFIAVDSNITSDILILEERNDIEFLGITLPELPIYANHLSAIQTISNKLLYCVYAMPNLRFHFAISDDSCVHKRHFVIAATHES